MKILCPKTLMLLTVGSILSVNYSLAAAVGTVTGVCSNVISSIPSTCSQTNNSINCQPVSYDQNNNLVRPVSPPNTAWISNFKAGTSPTLRFKNHSTNQSCSLVCTNGVKWQWFNQGGTLQCANYSSP